MKRLGYIATIAASLFIFAFGGYLLFFQSARLPRVDMLLDVPLPDFSHAEPLRVDVSSFDWIYTWDNSPMRDSQNVWVYDLFTPPILWRDALTQQLVSVVPESVLNAEDWGVKLLSLDREWYRLQFEGYTDGGAASKGKAKLYFDDLVYGRRVVGYVGSRIPKMGVRVLAFDPHARDARSLKSGMTASRNPEVIILDEVTGEEVVLNQRDPKYTSRWVARIGFSDAREIRFNEVGESHVLGNTRISVDSVNFETGCITLQREDLITGKVEYAVVSQ